MSASDNERRRQAVLLLRDWTLRAMSTPGASDRDLDIYCKIFAGTEVLLKTRFPAPALVDERPRARAPRRPIALKRADFDPNLNRGRA